MHAPRNEERAIKGYLNLLSFDQLIGESEQVAKEITSAAFSDDLSLRCRLVVDEMSERIGTVSSFSEIKKAIEEKLALLVPSDL
jgi:uncharacterized small protein (DUF1192 family)